MRAENANRVNVLQGVRAYWVHLIPMPLLVPVILFTLTFTPLALGSLLTCVEFLGVSVFCIWPYLRGRVGRSYLTLVNCLFLGGVLVLGLPELVVVCLRRL